MRRSRWLATASVLSLALVTFLGLAAFNLSMAPPNAEATDEPNIAESIAMASDGPIDAQPIVAAPGGGAAHPIVLAPTLISQLTGAGSPARTDRRWNIAGTDLGFSFEHNDTLYMVFGDTWGKGGNEGPDWRSNTMAIVEPHPDYGYILTDVIKDSNGEAKELLSSLKQPRTEYTVIPTSGISVGERMYLHYMSIRDWDEHWWGYKEPVVNGAGFAYSDDQGQNWIKDETAQWTGNSAFTQTALVADNDDIYVFGTPAGRFGPTRLLRVPGDHLLQPERYEYWTGDTWDTDINSSVEVIPAPVGELSVRWSPYHRRWLMMYLNESTHNIVLRTAEQLQGPWDEEQVIVTSEEYPTLYGPFMLPITGPDVYFAMSTFTPDYQVFLMRLTPESG